MGDRKNEGEGNKTADRHYRDATESFIKSGKVDKAARDAEKAMESDERKELEKAEEKGKSHAKH
jgi:hypothetical protein